MATIYSYIFMLFGVSLLLGLAGVGTVGSGILGLFGIHATNSGVTGVENLSTNIVLNPFMGTMLAIILGLTGFAIASLALRFDLGASLKVGAITSLFTIMLTEFVAIMNAVDSGAMGGVISLVAVVIYLPIAVATSIAILNWVGGNN